MFAALQADEADVCVLDPARGEEAVSFVRTARQAGFTVPIVALLETGESDLAAPLLAAGANDIVLEAEADALTLDRAARYASDRAQAVDTLRASWQRFPALLQNSGEGIVVLDTAGKIRFANDSFRRIAGYWPHELIGKYLFDLAHPDDVWQAQLLFEECLAARSLPIAAAFRVRHREGHWRTLECSLASHADDPDVRGIVANCVDVTERDRAVRENRRLTRRVEQQRQQLALLHAAVRILHADRGRWWEPLAQVARILPLGWADADRVAARITIGGVQTASAGFDPARVRQRGRFHLIDGRDGLVEVAFLDERPWEATSLTPAEQQGLLDSVCVMIERYCNRRLRCETPDAPLLRDPDPAEDAFPVSVPSDATAGGVGSERPLWSLTDEAFDVRERKSWVSAEGR